MNQYTDTLDLEARAHSEHAHELRLWLRLLTCSQLIEKRVRTGLREQAAQGAERGGQCGGHEDPIVGEARGPTFGADSGWAAVARSSGAPA